MHAISETNLAQSEISVDVALQAQKLSRKFLCEPHSTTLVESPFLAHLRQVDVFVFN